MVSTNGNYVSIDFGDKDTKDFIYPDAFETFETGRFPAQAAVKKRLLQLRLRRRQRQMPQRPRGLQLMKDAEPSRRRRRKEKRNRR